MSSRNNKRWLNTLQFIIFTQLCRPAGWTCFLPLSCSLSACVTDKPRHSGLLTGCITARSHKYWCMKKNKKTAHCRRADRQTTGVWTHAGACACLFGCTCGSVWWYTVKTAWMHEYFISFLILKSTLIKFNNISVVFCIVGDDLAVDIFGRPQVFFPLLSFWFILTSTPLLPHFLLFFRLLLLSAIPALCNSEWNDVRTASVWISPIFSHESRQTFPLSLEKVQLRLMRSV